MTPKKRSQNKSAEQSADREAFRYRKVLTLLLNENCTQYTWYNLLSGALRAGQWSTVYAWADSVTTEVYDHAAEHYAANQMSALIRKYPFVYSDIGLDVDPEERAHQTFLAAERRCEVSNKRLTGKRVNRSKYGKYISYMRKWIRQVLGDSPDLREIYDECKHGPGACIGVHGDATNLYRKMYAESWTVSPGAKVYAIHAVWSNDQISYSYFPSRGGIVCYDVDFAKSSMLSRCTLTSFNQVSFVPKTAKTHRSIAIEPLLNAYIQSGADRVMRKLLRAWGYDLTDQSLNAELARRGSIDGHLATMDLSSASDSLSISLCRLLLPADWFEFLDSVRSPSYQYDGSVHRYQKFVSMGNGFCFPLQTLIFAAATRAAIHFTGSEGTHSVYGDDMIAPTSAYPLLSKILAFCGCTVNPVKSFADGSFRESCGADWYAGQDVRPVYLDYQLTGDTQLMIFHNATYRNSFTSRFFEPLRPLLREWVPEHRRYTRPFPHEFKQWSRRLGDDPLSFARKGSLDMYVFDPRRRKLNLSQTLPSWTESKRKDDFFELAAVNGAFDVPMDVFMGSKFAEWNMHEQRWAWTERVFTPVEDKPDGDPAHFHRASYLAFLSGSLEGKLYLRRKTKPAKHIT